MGGTKRQRNEKAKERQKKKQESVTGIESCPRQEKREKKAVVKWRVQENNHSYISCVMRVRVRNFV